MVEWYCSNTTTAPVGVDEQGEGTKAAISAVESGQEEDKGWGEGGRIHKRGTHGGH